MKWKISDRDAQREARKLFEKEKIPEPREGIIYKNMGVQESQNCTVITMIRGHVSLLDAATSASRKNLFGIPVFHGKKIYKAWVISAPV